MVQSKVDTSEVSKNSRANRETVAPRWKSLRDPKIALSGRVNEGERKLGTRRASWWTRREGVGGRAKKRGGEGKWEGKRKERREKRRRLRRWVRAHTRVKPKRGPVPWTLHKPALSTLFSPLSQAGSLYLRPYGPSFSSSLSSLIDREARY